MSQKKTYKNKILIKKARSMSDYIKLAFAFIVMMGVMTTCSYWLLFKYHQKYLLTQVNSCLTEERQLRALNSNLFKEKTVLEQKLHVKEEEGLAIKQDLLKSYEEVSNMEKKIVLYKKVIKNKV
tara:strand:- start:13570 stop:13941 length:372 start_codon:yes stop_codon:yes gene_type:complete